MGPGREVRAVPAAGVAAGVRADRAGPAARGAVHSPAGRAVAAVRGQWSGSGALLIFRWLRAGAVAGLSPGGVPRSPRSPPLIPSGRSEHSRPTLALLCRTASPVSPA